MKSHIVISSQQKQYLVIGNKYVMCKMQIYQYLEQPIDIAKSELFSYQTSINR